VRVMALLGPTYKTGGFHINQLTVGEMRKKFRGKDVTSNRGQKGGSTKIEVVVF